MTLSALRADELILAWPVLTVALLVALPTTRRRLRSAKPRRLRLAWHWGVAGTAALAVVVKYLHGTMLAVPGHGKGYAVDLLYHLAIVEDAVLRGVPLQNPQVAGELLRYHWFADAHLAAAATATGADPRELLFRTWLAPMLLAFTVAVAALGRQIVKTWWAGVAAAAVAVLGTAGLGVFRNGSSVDFDAFFVYSPSQEFAAVTSVGLFAAMLGVLEHNWKRPGWALLVLALLGNSGAKPTMLPLAAAGCLGWLLVAAWQRDRSRVRTGVTVFATVAAVWLLATLTVTGSNTGSSLSAWAWFHQQAQTPATVLAAVAAGAGSLALVLVSWLTIRSAPRRDLRVRAWLTAATLAGLVAFVLLDHPGNSEIYFLLGTVPFLGIGALLAARPSLASLPGRRRWRLAAVALAGGGLVAAIIRMMVESSDLGRPAQQATGFWLPATATLVILGGGVATWWGLRGRLALRGAGVAALVFALLGGVLATGPLRDLAGPKSGVLHTNKLYYFTPDEQAGADWIRDHTPPTSIVATPTYCLPRRPVCDARGFLITAMGARRTLLEGWAYTVESMAAAGKAGGFVGLPAPWPERKALTDETMTRPTTSTMDRLTAEGVDVIFTDSSVPAAAKAALDRLAVVVFSRGDVRIYEMQ